MSSWTPATQNQYNVYLGKCTEFYLQGQINPMLLSVNDVLTFLFCLYDQQLSYSTINTARSALSSYLMDAKFTETRYTVATHLFIVRFMKGVFNSRKPAAKYSKT